MVLFLKSYGLKHKDICAICRISRPTLVGYFTEYKEKGIAGLKVFRWKGQPSKLNAYKELIDKEFEKVPPKTVNEAQDRIEKLTGIRRSPTQIQAFLKKLEYKYLKTGSVPGNGDGQDELREEEREDFKKNNCCHAWKKQKEGKG